MTWNRDAAKREKRYRERSASLPDVEEKGLKESRGTDRGQERRKKRSRDRSRDRGRKRSEGHRQS